MTAGDQPPVEQEVVGEDDPLTVDDVVQDFDSICDRVVDSYEEVARAYIRGLERLVAELGDAR